MLLSPFPVRQGLFQTRGQALYCPDLLLTCPAPGEASAGHLLYPAIGDRDPQGVGGRDGWRSTETLCGPGAGKGGGGAVLRAQQDGSGAGGPYTREGVRRPGRSRARPSTRCQARRPRIGR